MITVLLFARLQEEAGTGRFELAVEPITVQELKIHISRLYPLINLDHVMTAVNEDMVLASHEIQSGDTVALLPMVSGG